MERRTGSRTQGLDSQPSAPSIVPQSASGGAKDEKPMLSLPPFIHPGPGKAHDLGALDMAEGAKG